MKDTDRLWSVAKLLEAALIDGIESRQSKEFIQTALLTATMPEEWVKNNSTQIRKDLDEAKKLIAAQK